MTKHRPYQRTDRLAKQLEEILAVALSRETREEALHGVVVTGVEVTRDLSLARVYYDVMVDAPETEFPGAPEPDEQLEEILARATGFLRSRIGQQARIRHIPELRFIRDTSIEHGRRIEGLLREIAAERAAHGEPDEDGDGS